MIGLAHVQSRIAEIEARLGSLGLSAVAAGRSSNLPAAEFSTRLAAAATRAPSSAASAAAWASALPAAGRARSGDIEAAAEAAGLDPRLLAAVVWAESGFDADAVSPAGAIGLGQLMPATAAALGVDPHDPRANLDGAARYLREQLDRFGSVDLALAAYNAGPGRVAQAGGVPRIPETEAYVPKVLELLGRLESV